MALCTTSQSTNQVLEAMRWYFGKRQCRTITFVDDVAGALDGEYFELNVINNEYVEEKKVVLLSDGTTTTIAGLPATTELIVVTFTVADTAATIAGLVATALIPHEVRTEIMGDSLDIQNQFVGAITVEDNTNAPSETFAIGALGFGGYLGQSGESEMTATTEKVQLLDDAQGTIIQDEIITGHAIELAIPLREMTSARWETLIGNVAGDNLAIDAKTVTGYGTSKLYTSMFSYSGRLVGHPVRLPASNIDEDIVLLNTAPTMDSINFSGASIQEASMTFVAYKDANADTKINLMARGDHSLF